MAGDYLPDDLKILWKDLSTNPLEISPDQLRQEAATLRKGLRRRSLIGGGAAWSVIAAFTLFFFIFPNPWQRVGSILTAVGAAVMLVQLRMRPPRALPEMGETGCVRFYRAELERQRDFHRGMWFWSRLLALLPGPLIFCLGFAQAYPSLAPFIWLESASLLILAAIAVPMNLKLAGKYQRRLNVLDASIKSTE